MALCCAVWQWCGSGVAAVWQRCGVMAKVHLRMSAVVLALALVLAVPVMAGEGGMLTSLESCCGRAMDVSAFGPRTCWLVLHSCSRWVPAAAVAVAQLGEGVRCSFCLASGLGR